MFLAPAFNHFSRPTITEHIVHTLSPSLSFSDSLTLSSPRSLPLSLCLSPPLHKFSRRDFFFNLVCPHFYYLLPRCLGTRALKVQARMHSCTTHCTHTYASWENVHVPASGSGHVIRTCETSPVLQAQRRIRVNHLHRHAPNDLPQPWIFFFHILTAKQYVIPLVQLLLLPENFLNIHSELFNRQPLANHLKYAPVNVQMLLFRQGDDRQASHRLMQSTTKRHTVPKL